MEQLFLCNFCRYMHIDKIYKSHTLFGSSLFVSQSYVAVSL